MLITSSLVKRLFHALSILENTINWVSSQEQDVFLRKEIKKKERERSKPSQSLPNRFFKICSDEASFLFFFFNDIFIRNSEKHDFCLPKINCMTLSLACLKALPTAKAESSREVHLKKIMRKKVRQTELILQVLCNNKLHHFLMN